jgi:hypothetical protein
MKFQLPKFGLFLIVLGTLGFVVAVIMSFTSYSGVDQGALPAASFLGILIGIAFAFPSLLQDTKGGMSTMRITVFAVVLLFCVIYIKIGWTITKFEQLTIDQRWVYILGLALGSKAFQRFGENEADDAAGSSVEERVSVKKEVKTSSTEKGKDTSADIEQ